MKPVHTIGKLLLELQLPTAEGSFLLQEKLSRTCADELPGLLEEVLDDWAPPGELLRIDRLEIDLGAILPTELEKTLLQLIVDHLRRQSLSLMAAVDEKVRLQRFPTAYGHLESWLHYLQHGLLPHLVSISDRAEWERSVLETLATDAFAVQECQQVLKTNEDAVNRLVLQFSTAFLQQWIAAFSGEKYSRELRLIAEWITLISQPQRSLSVASGDASFVLQSLPPAAVVQQKLYRWLIGRIASNALPQDADRLLEEQLLLFVEKLALQKWLPAIEDHLATTNNQWKELPQAVMHLKMRLGVEKAKDRKSVV